MRLVLLVLSLAAAAFTQASIPEPSVLVDQLSKLQLDTQQVYSIRDISLHRDVFSISLDRGFIAFLSPVNGRVTGAVFVGNGEIVAIPQDATERQQIYRYTQSPILSQAFDTALLRFTDNTYDEIMRAYREHAQEDVEAADRANVLALSEEFVRKTQSYNHRVLSDFLGRPDRPGFMAQLRNSKLGWFTAALDPRLAEELYVAGTDAVWSSFSRRDGVFEGQSAIDVLSYEIECGISADVRVSAKASLRVRALRDGERVIHLVLDPALEIASVASGEGKPLIHTRTANRIAVVLPEPAKAKQELTIQIAYGGAVIDGFSPASPGVSREAWYPSSESPDWAKFALTFRFPATLNVMAGASKTSERESGGERVSAWATDSDVLDTGFAISRCAPQSKEAGAFSLHTCIPAEAPDAKSVGGGFMDRVRAIADFFGGSFGAYPYKQLHLSTLPSSAARSGPALIYAPSTPSVQADGLAAREVARQWFGHAMAPKTYRDRWIVDGLAGYAAAMYLERAHSGAALQETLSRARAELLEKSPEGAAYADLGPVSIGGRLTQPHSTEAYIRAIENKSTWIMHMLRMMMRRGEDDSAFFAMLRELTAQFRGAFVAAADFKRIAEKHAGEPLDWFFDAWAATPGIPVYAIDFKVEQAGEEFVVDGRLFQAGVPDTFTMRVPIYADDQLLGAVNISGGEQSFRFTSRQKPRQVLIDPKGTVLAVRR